MGIFRATTGFLSLKPSVWGDDEYIYCESSLVAQMVSLFAYRRLVVVDRRREVIHISTRRWWTRHCTVEIPFARVERIEYEFSTFPGWFALPYFPIPMESFTVSLVLRETEEVVPLASFRGTGVPLEGCVSVVTPCVEAGLPVMPSGDQGDSSLHFVRKLQEMLGVPIGLPLPHGADEAGRKYRCSACGRNSPPRREKCQYCGGQVARIGEP